jgi:predicted nucleic acid-binding protein
LLDTSVLVSLEDLDGSADLPLVGVISTISLAELSVGPLVANGPEATRRQTRLQHIEADFEALPFDSNAARAFGAVAASIRRRGRKVSARTDDALIAAVAIIANGLPLFTCNPRDFEGVDRLQVVAVPPPR